MPAPIAFLFPGQGAQHVGMGMTLARAFPEAAAAFEEADQAFGACDGSTRTLSQLVFEGPEDDLVLTEHAQPAILATSVAALRVLSGRGIAPQFVAGHSLGEYSANVAAGTLEFPEAVALVRERGRLMQEAVPVGTGSMAAILGAELDVVARACQESGGGEVVSPANINAPGQVVIAGHTGAVKRAAERAKELGARKAIALTVSAPFHCALMRPAEERLAPRLRAIRAHAPKVPVVANLDAQPKHDALSAIEALVRQVSAPVLWQAIVERLVADGVRTFVEVGPGSVLSGLVKKVAKDADPTIVKFGAPEDLDGVLAVCST
jgi:[acyl-carrier-protein] S-malonyltransferase